jgi:phosphoribosylaminoimidazolecarboxamide formyltransferase/IMP cyclohydrolase
MAIKNAIVSVSNKENIVDFCKKLTSLNINILSTGGTAKILKNSNIKVTDISEYTGFPEMMDGRVKTLHPKVHGGILALRDNPEHMEKLKAHNMITIDMVVVNLYPFQKTIANPDCTFEDAIENIDIGGPTMIRAAAKNFKYVVVIVDPEDYTKVLDEIESNGDVSFNTRLFLAKKVFKTMSEYDGAIYKYLEKF